MPGMLIGNPRWDNRLLKQKNEESLVTVRRGETRQGATVKVLFIEAS